MLIALAPCQKFHSNTVYRFCKQDAKKKITGLICGEGPKTGESKFFLKFF